MAIRLVGLPPPRPRPPLRGCGGLPLAPPGRYRPPQVGLRTPVKPLIRPLTAGEFDSPSPFFADAQKSPKMKTARLVN
eukprot:1193802-Prorocentrum_minimum.AAC.2